LQADLKTFHQLGVYGMSVVTLLTVQNTRGVDAVFPVEANIVLRQLDAVLEDIPPHAAKTGALGTAAVVERLAERAARWTFPLVIDPVLAGTHGAHLLADAGLAALLTHLLPHATLVTPNLAEASALAGIAVQDVASMERAARIIANFGPRAVLVKGGHLEDEAIDVLCVREDATERVELFRAPRIPTRHTHGTGCVLSAAIVAELAKGYAPREAIERAKTFVTRALESAPGLGEGHGPLNLHAKP
jgi:hydroxymethylpyrimidine/phosphomethylpyrimidine kinase